MKAIIKDPGQKPRSIFITRGNTQLHLLQELVGGGRIKTEQIQDVVLVFNEDGPERGFETNIHMPESDLLGTVIFLGIDGRDFTDCPLDVKGVEELIRMMEK